MKIKIQKLIMMINNILISPVKLATFMGYIILCFVIWSLGYQYIPDFPYDKISNLYRIIFSVFIAEMSVIGMVAFVSRFGIPKEAKKIEKILLGLNLYDEKERLPALINYHKKDYKTTYELYSPTVSIKRYLDAKEDLRNRLNLDSLNISYIVDNQYIRIEGYPKFNPPQVMHWKDEFLHKDDFVLNLGEKIEGSVLCDLSKTPHMLIGGQTGSGKSVLLDLILHQCILKNALIKIADFKGGIDFYQYADKTKIITSLEELNNMLSEVCEIIQERTDILVKSKTRDISEYNKKHPDDAIQRIIVVIDEFAEAMIQSKTYTKEKNNLIEENKRFLETIARIGRAMGIHLILCMQRPDSRALEGQIKANLGYKICGAADKILSDIVLDNYMAAEELNSEENEKGWFILKDRKFKAYYYKENFDERENQYKG